MQTKSSRGPSEEIWIGAAPGKDTAAMFLSERGNMGLRIIVFMGAATFLFLMLMAFGLKKSLQPQTGSQVPPGAPTSPFQEDRAWADLEALRAPDPGAENFRRDHVERAMRKAGLRTRQIALAGPGAADAHSETATLGLVEGNRPGAVILCVALPTAENGAEAADAAWLLEMTRILGRERDGRSVWAVFLEIPESPIAEGAPTNSGDALVDALKKSGDLSAVDAVVAIQGIGDCALAVRKEAGAPPVLIEIIWNTATRNGYEKFFGRLPTRVRGIHSAFRDAGIPAIGISDAHSRPAVARKDTSHAESCRESLRAVGDVIYHALTPIDGHLDETGMRSDGH